MKFSVLYAEDEEELAIPLIDYLNFGAFNVVYVANGTEALKKYKSVVPDIVLLDIMMPDISGYEVASSIRRKDLTTPILFLSSLGGTSDVVKGLDLGANDYIRKETAMEEIEARLIAALRNSKRDNSASKVRISLNTYVDIKKRVVVSLGGEEISLSFREYNLLYYLIHNTNTVINRILLQRNIWGEDVNSSLYLSKALSRLRSVFSRDKDIEIKSYRSSGIVFRVKIVKEAGPNYQLHNLGDSVK